MDRFGFEVAESHLSINLLGFNRIVGLDFNVFRWVGQGLEQLLEIKRVSIGNLTVIGGSTKIVQYKYRHDVFQ